MTQQTTIQGLITKNDEYKAKAWFSKDFWDKLTSAYSNLNHVMASEIVKAVKNVNSSRKFEDPQYATNFAQLLVDKRVSISALVGVMRANNLIFSGQHFYKFLDTLHNKYVRQQGLFTEEVMYRMEAIKALPFVGHNELSDEEKQYIQKSDTPLEIVDILIQKPVSKSFAEYPAFVESAVQDINTGRKTEVILLGLKNLMNYENIYTDKVVVKKADELLNEYNPVNAPDGKIGDKTQGECIDKIKEFIRETESDEDKKTALANKLFNSLNGSNLIGTGHEKAVVEYVAGIDEANRDQAIAYSIYKAREALKAEVKEAANGLRKSLLGVAQIDLIKTDGVEFKKDGQDIPIKKLLEKAANSGRLQRAAKRYVMKLLKGGDAAATVSGKGNLQAMAAMLGSMDQETFTLIGQIMGSTMAEIESEHNFNPEFWAGTISRGWNKFTSYPADAFFAVIDFFAIVFEYIGEYVTRGAYKAYEGVRGVTEDQKRQDQDIFKQADVDTAMGELVKSLKEVNISTVISTDKDQLRDAIVVFLKDNTNSKDLKEKLTTVGDGIGGGELKTAIGKLTTQTVLTQHKKDLQAILDMPEMNQNASNALPSWAKAAKAVNVLKLAK